MPKKLKTYTYYKSMYWTDPDDKEKRSMATQLYEACGVYVAISAGNRPESQFGADPKRFGKQQRKHIQQMRDAGIEVELGTEATVAENEDGFWYELTQEQIDANE